MTATPWHARRYRANLIDMHIPDVDPAFLARFDATDYVERLLAARVEVAYLYASSCLGISYWPTRAGHMHAGLRGRDILAERIDLCRRHGLDVVVYYNWWSKWAYDEHPDWRVVDARGRHTADHLWTPGRYGVCCFNSPHAEFALAQVEELCTGYDFDGLWVDMIFWPYTVCHCGHCRRRWHDESGRDWPRRVDWEDPAWVEFQRRREAWMTEFVGRVTATAKRLKPGVSVGHQCSPWSVGWTSGVDEGFFRQSDYLAGDFYGGATQQSLVCKLFGRLGERPLFEFMTSRTPDLTDHTTMKEPALLRLQAWSALAHNGRTLFIDAIDPAGTLNPAVYVELGEVFAAVAPYQPFLGPDDRLLADVAIYFNFASLIDLADNGRSLAEAGGGTPPVVTALPRLARALLDGHVGHTVITPRQLDALDDFGLVILPDLPMLSPEEAEALRRYVERGGRLCVTGGTSLLTTDGRRQADFLLADVLGVTWRGRTAEAVTYMEPAPGSEALFAPYTAAHPLCLAGAQMLVQARPGARVLATVALPYTDPADATRCSSAISNPNGVRTAWPAAVLHDYGKGRALYLAGPLERMEHEAQRRVLRRLLGLVAPPPRVRTDLPPVVEVLVHEQARPAGAREGRLRVCLLNFQERLPPVPVCGARLSVDLDGAEAVRVVRLPDGAAIPHTAGDGHVEFVVERLDEFLMLAVDTLHPKEA